MQKFRTIQVKGKSFDISVSQNGEFQSTYDDEAVSAETLKSLVSKLATRISREKRVNIRVGHWDKEGWSNKPGRLRMGTIIGIHAGNDNLLVKWDGDKGSEQFGRTNAFVDPKHAKQLKRLGEALDRAQKAFDAFMKKHSLNAWECVQDLLRESDAH